MPNLGDRTQFYTTDGDNTTISNGKAAPRIDAQIRKLAGAAARHYDFLAYKVESPSGSTKVEMVYPDEALSDWHDGQPLTFYKTADLVSTPTVKASFTPSGATLTAKNVSISTNNGAVSYSSSSLNQNIQNAQLTHGIYNLADDKFIITDSNLVFLSGQPSADGQVVRFLDGTQIWYGTVSITAVANVATYVTINIGTYDFISTTGVTVNTSVSFTGTTVQETQYTALTTTTVDIGIVATTAGARTVSYHIVGRWF